MIKVKEEKRVSHEDFKQLAMIQRETRKNESQISTWYTDYDAERSRMKAVKEGEESKSSTSYARHDAENPERKSDDKQKA